MDTQDKNESALQKHELQNVIIREVDLLEREESKQGFTKWAVIGALSILLWKAIELFPTINLIDSLQIFLSIIFLSSFCLIILRILLANTIGSSNTPSKMFSFGTSAKRANAFAIAAIFIVLTFCAYHISIAKTGWQWNLPIALFLSISLMFLMMVAIYLLPIPILSIETMQKSSKLIRLIIFVFCASVTYSAYIYVTDVLELGLYKKFDNLKLSIIFFAAFFLILREVSKFETREKWTHLRRLEVDLALCNITAEEGLDRFKTLMLGSTMHAVIKPWIEQVTLYADDIKSNLQECSRLLNIARDELEKDSPNKTDIVYALLDQVTELLMITKDGMKSGLNAANIFVLKIQFFTQMSGLDKKDIEFAVNKVRTVYDDVKYAINTVSADLERLPRRPGQ